jgi:hypothetical protein
LKVNDLKSPGCSWLWVQKKKKYEDLAILVEIHEAGGKGGINKKSNDKRKGSEKT